MATLLGFDYGTRKIGIAVGQTVSGTANALTTVRARGQRPDWKRIEGIIREWQPDAVVLGLPMRMDDTEEDWADRVRRFARQLEGRFGLAVHLVDERLTTLQAESDLGLRDAAPDDRVDAWAAKLILETWLGSQGSDAEAAAPRRPAE